MMARSNAELRPQTTAATTAPAGTPADTSGSSTSTPPAMRPASGSPVESTAWWQITGDETEDACYLVERWLDSELELIQVPLEVITLAAEQVQDVRLALLETAGDMSWPELLVSALIGFMTNSPYGGLLIQRFTTRVLQSALNSSAILRASESFARRAKPGVEFFRYAGELYQYVPVRGTATPSSITTRQIAEFYELLKSNFFRGLGSAGEGAGAAVQTVERALSDQQLIQGITEGLSQSAVTVGQGGLGSRPSSLPAEDTPGVTILDECMTRASAQRSLTRATASSLIAHARSGRVKGSQIAAQIPPAVGQDLAQYRRRARLQAEALLWVQIVPVTGEFRFGQTFSGRTRLATDASDRLIGYWRDRFGPLIAGSPTLGPQWRAAAASYQSDLAAYNRSTFLGTFGPSINLRRSGESVNQLMLTYLRELRENLQAEIRALQTPPEAGTPSSQAPAGPPSMTR